MEIRRPAGAAAPADGGGSVAVDATSAAGGLRVDPTQFDAYYFAPQKCFASDGGLWVALLSPAALDRVERHRRVGAVGPGVPRPEDRHRQLRPGPDLQHAGARPRCCSSPSRSSGCWPAAASNGPPGAATGRPRSSTPGPSSRTSPRPSWSKPSERSHVVGTIDFVDAVDAAAVAKVLRANGIVDTEPYRKLGRNQLRIAMFPAIDPEDVAALCACINHVVGALAS